MPESTPNRLPSVRDAAPPEGLRGPLSATRPQVHRPGGESA